jgi:hypothetical protein
MGVLLGLPAERDAQGGQGVAWVGVAQGQGAWDVGGIGGNGRDARELGGASLGVWFGEGGGTCVRWKDVLSKCLQLVDLLVGWVGGGAWKRMGKHDWS